MGGWLVGRATATGRQRPRHAAATTEGRAVLIDAGRSIGAAEQRRRCLGEPRCCRLAISTARSQGCHIGRNVANSATFKPANGRKIGLSSEYSWRILGYFWNDFVPWATRIWATFPMVMATFYGKPMATMAGLPEAEAKEAWSLGFCCCAVCAQCECAHCAAPIDNHTTCLCVCDFVCTLYRVLCTQYKHSQSHVYRCVHTLSA